MSSKRVGTDLENPSSKRTRHGGGRRFLRSSDPDTFDDNLICSHCNQSIAYQADFASLEPCGCAVCTKCLLNAHAQRGTSLLTCCNMDVTSHKFHGPRRVPIGNNTQYNTKEERLSQETIMQQRPMKYLIQTEGSIIRNNRDERVQSTVLYCATLTKEKGSATVKRDAVVKTFSCIGNQSITERGCNAISAFSAYLHPIITQPSIIPYDKIKPLLPQKLFNNAISNITPLMAFLSGLATGQSANPNDRFNSTNRGGVLPQVLATKVASDLLVRCVTRYPGESQLMISEQLQRQKVSAPFRDLLSTLRLAPSRKHTDKKSCERVVQTLLAGIKLGSHDMAILNGDNVGFTILGEEASYSQWILFQDIILREQRLKELNIHSNSAGCLSREPAQDWFQLCIADSKSLDNNGDLARRLVEVNDSDFDKLTESVMEGIYFARELVLQKRFKEGQMVLRIGYIISHETRMQLERGDIVHGDVVIGEENNGPTTDGAAEIHDNQIPQSSIVSEDFMCDGQPAAQMSKLIAADNRRFYLGEKAGPLPDDDLFPDDDDDYGEEFEHWFREFNCKFGFTGKGKGKDSDSKLNGKFMVFFGGFHAGLKLHNCRGMMFGNFVKGFYAAWRDTINKVNWILYPSDPRQLENELPHYILVHYRSAFEYLWEKMGNSEDNIPSPKDVHNYMLERAKHSPFRQATLLEIRYGEISKLMRMSAKVGSRGSVDLFLTAVRFGLTIWSTTHATEYVRLGCDLLAFMECAPPAVKELYANEMFTRYTATGKPEFADLIMEGSVYDIRQDLGKVERPGMAKGMERTCVDAPRRSTQTETLKDLRSGMSTEEKQSRSRSHEWFKAKSPAIKGFELIHKKMKLWHHTLEPVIKYENGKEIHAEPGSYDLPEDETLNPEVLCCFECGSERARRYMQKYYVDSPYKVERSEKDVPLTKILATSLDRKYELTKMINRVSSVEKEELDKALNKDETGQELLMVIEKLNFEVCVSPMIAPPSLSKLNKEQRIEKLIEYRQQYFDKKEGAKSKAEAAAKKEFHEKYPEFSLDKRLEDLYSNKIYCLSKSVLDQERYST